MWLDGRSPETYRAAIAAGSLRLAYTDSLQGFVEFDGDEISKLFVRGDAAGQGIGARLLSEALPFPGLGAYAGQTFAKQLGDFKAAGVSMVETPQ